MSYQEHISLHSQVSNTGAAPSRGDPNQAVKCKSLEQCPDFLFGKVVPASFEFRQQGFPAQSQSAPLHLPKDGKDGENAVQAIDVSAKNCSRSPVSCRFVTPSSPTS